MENTLENKGKFFAQYYGQQILKWHDKGMILKMIWTDLRNDLKENHYLEIKPLSSITDEDAYLVAKISFRGEEYHSSEIGKRLVQSVESENASYFSGALCCAIYDYLRSKGYALPYMGLNVEKQIEYGWIKLI